MTAKAMAEMGKVPYAGKRAEKKEYDRYIIDSTSEDMQIIADAMEGGFGL